MAQRPVEGILSDLRVATHAKNRAHMHALFEELLRKAASSEAVKAHRHEAQDGMMFDGDSYQPIMFCGGCNEWWGVI